MLVLALVLSASLQQAGLDRVETRAVAPARHGDTEIAPNGDVLQCRVQKVMGSHFTARYCLTADEWQRLHDTSVQALYGRTENHPNSQANAEGMNSH